MEMDWLQRNLFSFIFNNYFFWTTSFAFRSHGDIDLFILKNDFRLLFDDLSVFRFSSSFAFADVPEVGDVFVILL